VLLSVATVAPIAAISVWSIGRTVASLTDPCARWDTQSADGHASATLAPLGPNDGCAGVSFHGSKAREVALAAIFPGGLLAASFLAIAGAALSRRRVFLAGAILMLAETMFMHVMLPLTLAAGLFLLYLARRVAPSVQSDTLVIP
jgi:hypothetical protein